MFFEDALRRWGKAKIVEREIASRDFAATGRYQDSSRVEEAEAINPDDVTVSTSFYRGSGCGCGSQDVGPSAEVTITAPGGFYADIDLEDFNLTVMLAELIEVAGGTLEGR